MNIPLSKLEINSSNSVPTTDSQYGKEIPVVEDDLSYNDFFESFMLPNRPCLIRNLNKNWQCSLNWVKNNSLDVNYFLRNYDNVEVPVSDCSKREYNAQKKITMKLFDYLAYWDSRRSSQSKTDCLYLKDWHFCKDFPSKNIYTVPSYFASDWLNEYYENNSELNDDYKFVYIGPKGSWTPLHADVFASYSWSVNVFGDKKWILMPPGVEKYFTDDLGSLEYDIGLSTEKRHLENVPIYCIVQKKGEGLFVPSGWHHQVWNLVSTEFLHVQCKCPGQPGEVLNHIQEETVSVNHNWINGCNVHFVWKSLRENLDRVKKEISDCRDMEDWSSQCQLILSSTFGFDYRFFYSLLVHIARVRINALNVSPSRTADSPQISGWHFGENHIKFDLKRALAILNELQKNDDFLDVSNNFQKLSHSLEIMDSFNSFLNEKESCGDSHS